MLTIRDAAPSDAPFLAKCIMAGMHFYDFETDIPENRDIYDRLIECEQREDLLYSYSRTRVAEVDGRVAGSLLSYPGELYKDLRHRTFTELWPEFFKMDKMAQQMADSTIILIPNLSNATLNGTQRVKQRIEERQARAMGGGGSSSWGGGGGFSGGGHGGGVR